MSAGDSLIASLMLSERCRLAMAFDGGVRFGGVEGDQRRRRGADMGEAGEAAGGETGVRRVRPWVREAYLARLMRLTHMMIGPRVCLLSNTCVRNTARR